MEKEKQEAPDLKESFQEVLKLLKEAPPASAEIQNMELEEVIERLEESLGTLGQQMEEIYKKTGMTKQQLEEYAANPDNFSPEEWKLLGEIRSELSHFQEEAEETLGATPLEGRAGEAVTEKRAPKKRRGAVKKGWTKT